MKRSDQKPEDRHTRRVDSSRQCSEGIKEWARNLHCNNQYQVDAVGGTVEGDMRLTAGQHRDQGLMGDETHRRHPNAIGIGIKGTGDAGGEPALGGSTSYGGKRRYEGLKERGALGQTF